MSFYDQYELLELKRDDGVKTFHARNKTTNQFVTVHLFSSPNAPIQAELLRKIRKLPPTEAARILDRGSHVGSLYFVTDDLADYGGLLEWLTAVAKAEALRASAGTPEDRKPEERRPEPPRLSPISAIIEPAGQLKLNKEFAELFGESERPSARPQARPPAPPIAPPSAPPPARPAPQPMTVAKPDPEQQETLILTPSQAAAIAQALPPQPVPVPPPPVAHPVPPVPETASKGMRGATQFLVVAGVVLLAVIFLLYFAVGIRH